MRSARSDGPPKRQRGDEAGSSRIVIDWAGHPVDVSGSVWWLNTPTADLALNWRFYDMVPSSVRDAVQSYIEHLIRTKSPHEVSNSFKMLMILARCTSLGKSGRSDSIIPYKVISEARSLLRPDQHWQIHYLRKWYLWCVDQGFSEFSPEVAFMLSEIVVGGNRKGHAVLSADPDEGPLIDVEIVAFLNALRAARATGSLSLQEHVAVWLCVAFGCNPSQLALLRQDDLIKLKTDEPASVIHQLRVPRIKKGHAHARTEFKTRKLAAEIGQMVAELIAENQKRWKRIAVRGLGKPLFPRTAPRKTLVGGPLQEYALHLTANEITKLVAYAVRKLHVVSPRTGNPLRLTPRRLRYTFGTRLVREGASQRAVAEALDHTDLQNVRVYFDIKSDIVDKLDATMALTLGPLSQAFLGHLVRSEADAVRGERPSSRIYHHDKREQSLHAVGTCGSHSFCGLTAPIACYTCVKFQPWLDAPHGEVLSWLLDERKKMEDAGFDPKIVRLHDATILAVADVIARVEASQALQGTPHAD